jgi:transcription initiation factor TFIIE subunit beta
MWLETEALKNNPKISASIGSVPNGQTTYLFKPPYNMVNKKALIKVLRQHDLKGLGAILLDDIQESLPKCDKVMTQLIDEAKVIVLNRPADKKKVVFYHDHTADFNVDPEFVKLWRSVAVDSIDDDKIHEYLEKQGIRSMDDQGGRRIAWACGTSGRQRMRPKIGEDGRRLASSVIGIFQGIEHE